MHGFRASLQLAAGVALAAAAVSRRLS